MPGRSNRGSTWNRKNFRPTDRCKNPNKKRPLTNSTARKSTNRLPNWGLGRVGGGLPTCCRAVLGPSVCGQPTDRGESTAPAQPRLHGWQAALCVLLGACHPLIRPKSGDRLHRDSVYTRGSGHGRPRPRRANRSACPQAARQHTIRPSATTTQSGISR